MRHAPQYLSLFFNVLFFAYWGYCLLICSFLVKLSFGKVSLIPREDADHDSKEQSALVRKVHVTHHLIAQQAMHFKFHRACLTRASWNLCTCRRMYMCPALCHNTCRVEHLHPPQKLMEHQQDDLHIAITYHGSSYHTAGLVT